MQARVDRLRRRTEANRAIFMVEPFSGRRQRPANNSFGAPNY
ncbi:hypothetical protein [Streptomyces sannanensis]